MQIRKKDHTPETFALDYEDLRFEAPSLSGEGTVELHPGGASEPLAWDSRLRYCQEMERFRLREVCTHSQFR